MATIKNSAPTPLDETAPIRNWNVTWYIPNTAQGMQLKQVQSQSWSIAGGRVEFFNRTNDKGGKKIVFVLREQFLVTLEEQEADSAPAAAESAS